MDIDGEFHEDSAIKAWLEAEPNSELLLGNSDQECSQGLAEWPNQPSRVESIEYEDITLGLTFSFEDMHLANQYAKVLENKKMGDVKFILQDQEMTAHSDIVAAASPVMAAMLEPGNFEEVQTKTITIPGIEPTVFQQLLRFIYTGSAPRLGEESITKPLYLAADKFQLDTLKVICEECLIRHLKLDNAVENCLWAKVNLVPQLEEAAINFLIKHRKNIVDRPEWEELARSNPKEFVEITSTMISRINSL